MAMKISKGVFSILIILNILFLASIIYYYIETTKQLGVKESSIEILEKENTELNSKVDLLESERETVKAFLASMSEAKESELRNPTWDELKLFLELDDTNNIVYNDSFDCSGFSIELFKRARDVGLRCGLAEVEYMENVSGHMLNVFQTTDRGIVFVDVTGNENGKGTDKIAYVVIGKPYGIIDMSFVKERIVNCDVSCSQFAKEVTYVNVSNTFSYDYFYKLRDCMKFYEDCVSQYNSVIHEFNRGHSTYTYSEIQKWNDNLGILQYEITRNSFYVVSESQVVKAVQFYW